MRLILVLATACLLVGCGDKTGGAGRAPSGLTGSVAEVRSKVEGLAAEALEVSVDRQSSETAAALRDAANRAAGHLADFQRHVDRREPALEASVREALARDVLELETLIKRHRK